MKCKKEIETIKTLMWSLSSRWDNIFRCDPLIILTTLNTVLIK